MADLGLAEQHTVLCCRRGEDGVDTLQHRLGRAEGNREGDRSPAMPGALGALAEQVAQALELRRIGALERIDRLLGIADRNDGARHRLLSVLRARLVRAFAGEEVARQPLDARSEEHTSELQSLMRT